MAKLTTVVTVKMTKEQREALGRLCEQQDFFIGNPEKGRYNRAEAMRFLIDMYIQRTEPRDEERGESRYNHHLQVKEANKFG